MISDPQNKPIVWTVAGSDSGGGAGVQADLKTFAALGGHGCSVVTALTAQNTQGVFGTQSVSAEFFRSQWKVLLEDFKPAVIKTGMLASLEIVEALAELLAEASFEVVCDPVQQSTSGSSLLEVKAKAALEEKIFPYISCLTPNLPEAEAFLGTQLTDPDSIEKGAAYFLERGCQRVLIKGGHRLDDRSEDYWTDGTHSVWLSSPRRMGLQAHGTGCSLSAAIAVAKALGLEFLDAVVVAKAYVNRGLRLVQQTANGTGLLHHAPWPVQAEDFPRVKVWEEKSGGGAFPSAGEIPWGLYPIVDRTDWIERLLPLGVRNVQLRIKDLRGHALENEISRAVQLCRQYSCRLFINDYWELALKHQAYGVHLGQEDLNTANLRQLKEGNLHLGVSTHSYFELAQALSVQPTYVALGPIFPTLSKPMAFGPQGVERIRFWKALAPCPLIAIGGLSMEHIPAVMGAGADGMAVITDIVASPDPEGRVREWIHHLGAKEVK